MATLSYRGRKALEKVRDEYIDEFDSVVLEDWMHHVDDGDELVHHYAEAIANAQYAADGTDERYGWSDDIHRATDQAIEGLEAAFADHLDVLVAAVCAQVAQREGDWTDHRDGDAIEAAVHEAREWLQVHEAAAKRADVWDEVSE